MASEPFYIEPEGFGGWDTSGGGMRLLQQTGIGQRDHLIAHGRGTEIRGRDGARADWLAGLDVALDDRHQDCPLPLCDLSHCKTPQWIKFTLHVNSKCVLTPDRRHFVGSWTASP